MSGILEYIKSVIMLNDGSLIGKTRLQKTFFFLESKGAELDLDYDYHHYGPYSEDLAATLSFAGEADLHIKEINKTAHFPSFEFSVQGDHQAENVGALNPQEVKDILEVLSGFSSWELELAATIHYFKNAGMDFEEALYETKQRKTIKASEERLQKAQELLQSLSLL